jgi:glycine/D-amino acid oxidase-like deaminating enzyme
VAMVGPGLDGPSATRQSGGLIRAYDPDPRARALAARSFRLLWGRPAGQTRAFGFRETGSLVLLGESDVAEAVRGIEELRAAGIDVELVDREFVERTWPGLAVPDIAAAVWEPGGGYAAALATAGAYRAEAMRGGVLRWYGRVPGVRPHRHGVLVETDLGPVTARTAVVATGSGVPDLRNRRGTAIGPTARAKRIRYGYFDAGGRRLPVVADLVTGLWGRPNLAGGSYLAGRPVDELDPAQVDHIRAGAKTRWPWVGDAAYLGGRFGADLYGGAGPALGTMCAGLPVVAAGMFSGGGVKAAPAAAEVVADVVRALLT